MNLTPKWAPAKNTVPELLPDLQWVMTIHHHGVPIEQYKHADTRRYLNLDANGTPYRVLDGRAGDSPTEVAAISLAEAKAHVLS